MAENAGPGDAPGLTGGADGAGGASIEVTVALCLAPRDVREWVMLLPPGSCAGDALRACMGLENLRPVDGSEALQSMDLGIWGRMVQADTPLKHLDRVEIYRPLKVDPKVARRERFARQGARTTGLFARQRAGGKSGY